MSSPTSCRVQHLLHDIGIDLSSTDSSSWIQLLDIDILGQPYTSLLKSAIAALVHTSWATCRQKCKMLLDITWEQLYARHWKDVNITWRHAYTVVSFLKAVSEFGDDSYSIKDAIYTCDMGLLMGAPVLNNILARLATKLQLLDEDRCRNSASENSITSVSNPQIVDHSEQGFESILCGGKVITEVCPSLEHFDKVYVKTGTPVILRNCMDHWPAMCHNRWSPQYMQAVAGCRLVPVELGSKYTDQSWSQKLMTVSDYFQQYVLTGCDADDGGNRPTEVGYLAQHQLFNQVPRLREDIVIPDYCALSACDNDDDAEEVDINAWFGPAATVSPLHRDEKRNLLAQVVGAKYIRLYHPEMTQGLYPHSSHLLSTTSQVDVESPDLQEFPLFAGVTFSDCILRAGDMLYIPPMYWHYIRSLTTSFSVSFWWS